MIAVTRLIARALDNRVRRLLLDDAAGVSTLAAELRGAAASGVGQGNQRGDNDEDRPGRRRVLPPHSPPRFRDPDDLALTLSAATNDLDRPFLSGRGNAPHRDLDVMTPRSQRAIDRRHIDIYPTSRASPDIAPNFSERMFFRS